MTRTKVLLFDVNETLLDLVALQPAFGELFGTTDVIGEWFARLLHSSLVCNHLGRYRPFDHLAAETLINLGVRKGVAIDPDQALQVVDGMKRLPPHPDVADGLKALASAGFRLAALTNNPPEALEAQLLNAGIAGHFEQRISVEGVKRFKPAPEVYLHAATLLGVEVDEVALVAAHDWDVAGARSVGMGAVFLARPRAVWGLPDTPPAVVASDLIDLAGQLR